MASKKQPSFPSSPEQKSNPKNFDSQQKEHHLPHYESNVSREQLNREKHKHSQEHSPSFKDLAQNSQRRASRLERGEKGFNSPTTNKE